MVQWLGLGLSLKKKKKEEEEAALGKVAGTLHKASVSSLRRCTEVGCVSLTHRLAASDSFLPASPSPEESPEVC